MVDINDYIEETVCEYRGETYHVRDNGAIMRIPQPSKPIRKKDNVWTFGDTLHHGYLRYCNVPVHRIVCTAFNGPAPTDQHVVDHIDTNRQNNRPENLRWLTKLENILNNEITRRKVEYICGSIEAFLQNPQLLKGHEAENSNFEWMRNVSKEEAENTLKNWSQLRSMPADGTLSSASIGEWIYRDVQERNLDPIIEHLGSRIDYEKMEADRIAEKKRRKEEEKEARKVAAKLAAQDKSRKQKCLTEAFLSIAKEKGWSVECNYKGNGWKSDLLISYRDVRVALLLYKTCRGVDEFLSAMSADGVKGFWLGAAPERNDDPQKPCFPVDFDKDSIKICLPMEVKLNLESFLSVVFSGQLWQKGTLKVEKVKVRFVSTECYNCKKKHYFYFVSNILSSEAPEVSLNDVCFSLKDEKSPFDVFSPIIVKSVMNYLKKNSTIHYNIGEIKVRSTHYGDSYMSFGCPNCDSLLGDFYRNNTIAEMYYQEDDEDTHIIELENKGITVPFKHWVLDRSID